MSFIILLVVLGGLAYRMTSPEDRSRYLVIAIGLARRLKVAATEPGPEYESFREALRTRTKYALVTPAIVAVNVIVVGGMLLGAHAIGDPNTLVAWGASLGTRTTNGEWWRLVTSTVVHTGTLHLLVDVAVLIQLGAVLERLAGRLAFTGVYLSAGVFAGLVNLWSHPVAVTTGASGAIFGLYGLLLASLTWQLFRRRREDPAPDADESTESGVPSWEFADRLPGAAQPDPGPPTPEPRWGGDPGHARRSTQSAQRPQSNMSFRWLRGLCVHVRRIRPPILEPRWGGEETPAPDSVGEFRAQDTSTTIPLIAMKRLGVGAAVFLVYSALSGLAYAAEFSGLVVGLAYGLVLARRISEKEPNPQHVGAAIAAAAVIAVACAMPLRNITDVTPEMIRVLATEERTVAAYQAASDAFKKDRMTAEALAQLAERTIVPELQAADGRLKALVNVPPEHQGLVTDAREYLRLRCASWRARADAVRRAHANPRESPGTTDATRRLHGEARFRSNMTAMGKAESAERVSLEAFQRIKRPTLP